MSVFRKKKNPFLDARRVFQDELDYWDGRMAMGDPLFDQWMVDARKEALRGLDVMDKFEELGYRTGKDSIGPRAKQKVKKISVKKDNIWGGYRVSYDDNIYVGASEKIELTRAGILANARDSFPNLDFSDVKVYLDGKKL